MSDESERLRVLHAVRLGAVVDIEVLSQRHRLDSDLVRTQLRHAESAGWVIEHRGPLSGWAVTSAGRNEVDRLLLAELEEAGQRVEIEAAYAAFLELNGPFLAVCTDWQIRVDEAGTPQPNRHTDPDHDAAVLARLAPLHAGITEIGTRLTAAIERFGCYVPRFAHAWERLQANDVDWLTRPLIDSYHTVWFELHEDLLATLGRTRSSERGG